MLRLETESHFKSNGENFFVCTYVPVAHIEIEVPCKVTQPGTLQHGFNMFV